jgi:hypothetical protein
MILSGVGKKTNPVSKINHRKRASGLPNKHQVLSSNPSTNTHTHTHTHKENKRKKIWAIDLNRHLNKNPENDGLELYKKCSTSLTIREIESHGRTLLHSS